MSSKFDVVTLTGEEYGKLELDRADLLEALKLTQWGSNHRCPVCAGFNMMSPNGETDYKHTKTCIVGLAIARAEGK